MLREERAGPRLGLFVLALVMALSFLTVQAKADILAPGTTVNNAGDQFLYDPNTTTIVASTGLQKYSLTDTYGDVVDTGYYQIWAVTDPSNHFCAGCIDIMAQIAEVTGDGINTISFGSFAGFKVDAGYFPGWYMTAIGTVQPVSEVGADSVNRSHGAGSTVTFEYTVGILPGQDSDEIAIQTDARAFKPGSMQLIDAGITSVVGYAPAVPEPSVLSLLGLGLLALPMLRKKLF